MLQEIKKLKSKEEGKTETRKGKNYVFFEVNDEAEKEE